MENKKQRKKLLILAILEILREQSDADHPMRQRMMMNALTEGYGLTATRKSVGTNVQELIRHGYPIEHIGSGWYYDHEFTAAELDVLINNVLGNGAIPLGQQNDMIRKLRKLGSRTYQPLTSGNVQKAVNPHFFLNLEVLHEAIATDHQVSFEYVSYDVDKKLHARKDDNGETKIYICNPYSVVVCDGKSYLVCNKSNYDNLIHFRIDHIQNVQLLDAPRRPLSEIEMDSHIAPDSPEYIMVHAKMFTGHVGLFRVHIQRALVSPIIEQFGLGVQFENVTETEADALIETDEMSLRRALAIYGTQALIIGEEVVKTEPVVKKAAPALDENGQPIKRKRGRPRKNPLPDPNVPKIPKRRGRKPKALKELEAQQNK